MSDNSTRAESASDVVSSTFDDKDEPLFQTALLLTLLLMVFSPGDIWYLQLFIRIVAVTMLVWPQLRSHAWIWCCVFAVFFSVENILYWRFVDNHKFLYSYWFLTLACACVQRHRDDFLRNAARMLLGAVFLFATLRKVFAPEFISGDTMRYLLQFDRRFEEVARVICGLERDQLRALESDMSALSATIALPVSPRLDMVSFAMTWWTIVVEAVIGACALWSRHRWLSLVCHVLMLHFIFAVYPIAPVVGFARILAVLGFCSCDALMTYMRRAYLVTFVLIEAFSYPWLKDQVFDLISKFI